MARFKIHRLNADGTWGATPIDPQAKDGFYYEREAANVFLLEYLRLNPDMGQYSDYKIQAYNDKNQPVELVSNVDRDAAAADAAYLAEHSPDVASMVGGLMAARQLYVVVRQEAERMLAEEIRMPDGRLPSPLVLAVLEQAAQEKSSKVFTEVDLFQGMTHTVLPWLKAVIERHVATDAQDKEDAMVAADKARREVAIPLGMPLIDADYSLPRKKPLVLIGYGPAVQLLLQRILNAVLIASNDAHPNKLFSVLHFCAQKHAARTDNNRLIRIAKPAWQQCTTSKHKFDRMFSSYIRPQMSYPPDVLICDDLAAAAQGGLLAADEYIGGVAPFRCASALKHLIPWCKRSGQGLIAGIPSLALTPVGIHGAEWEAVHKHATLLEVRLDSSAESTKQTRITVDGGFYLDVDDSMLAIKRVI